MLKQEKRHAGCVSLVSETEQTYVYRLLLVRPTVTNQSGRDVFISDLTKRKHKTAVILKDLPQNTIIPK
jgi:hypothetical protein